MPTKLTICIATFNRAAFLQELLESIAVQMSENCDVVVSDNASTDDTEQVVSSFRRRFGNRVTYVKQELNVGVDRNYECAVEHARGEYCWLMADDDLMKPHAISAVLNALSHDFSVVVVNYERRTLDMTEVLLNRFINTRDNRVYGPGEFDQLFIDTALLLGYVGCAIIKRSIWLTRDRERYYGSMWMYFGVIFQASLPGETMFIAEPLVSYREANAKEYMSEVFEVMMIKWPTLLWDMAPSDAAKSAVVMREPWRHSKTLLGYRAMGYYSSQEYNRWIRPRLRHAREGVVPFLIALTPCLPLNTLLYLYALRSNGDWRALHLLWLRRSRTRILRRWARGLRALKLTPW